jgi:hypothetical protein
MAIDAGCTEEYFNPKDWRTDQWNIFHDDWECMGIPLAYIFPLLFIHSAYWSEYP